MKKLIASLVVTCFIFTVIFLSCKKVENNIKPEDNAFIEQVKNWFNKSFVNTAEYKNGIANGNFKMPNWKYGHTYKIGNTEIAEFPLISRRKKVYISEHLPEADKRRIIDNTKFKVLFVKAPGKIMQVRIIQFTPTFTYLESKNFNLNNLTFKDYKKEFKGDFMMFDFDNNFKVGYHYANNGIKNIKLNTKLPLKNTASKAPGGDESNLEETNCDNGVTIDPNCTYNIINIYEIECSGGWNAEEGYNPDYCTLEEIGLNCELVYCNPTGGGGTLEQCMNQGNTEEECLCLLYGICGGGGGGGGGEEEEQISCTTLSDALQNGYFTDGTGTGQSTVLSETASQIERADFFEVGTYKIPIWASWQFFANNKIIIEKTGNIKKFSDYTFGETTLLGYSVWYSCVANTLTSSHKTISSDKKKIDGTHFFHYKVSLLFEGCLTTSDGDKGQSFSRKIEDY